MYSDSFVIIYILHAYLHSRLDGGFDRLHCRRPCGTEGKGVGYGFMPLAEKYYSISPYAWYGNNLVRFVCRGKLYS